MNAELKPIESIGQLTVQERAVVALGSAEREAELIALAAKTTDIITITNQAGYEQVRTARIALKNERIDVQKCGKRGREEANKLADAIIAEEKRLVAIVEPEEDRLQVIQDAWDAARAAEEEAKVQAEMKRVADLQERIEELRGCQILTPASGSALIADHIADVEAIMVDASFEEFEEEAGKVKLATLARFCALHEAAETHEAEQRRLEAERVELAKQRAAEDERQRVAAQERAKQAADDKVRRDAEAAALAETNRIERERIAKEEADAKAILDAETKRLADERAENERIARERQADLDRQAAEQRAANAAEEQRLADQRAELERQQEELRKAQEPPLTILENKVTGEMLSIPPAEPAPASADVVWPTEGRAQLLERLLKDARYYVAMFEPRDDDESTERERVLLQIDAAIPQPTAPAVLDCENEACVLAKGHAGTCDDLPF